MESVISFVLLFSLLNTGLAAYVSVYNSFDYELMAKHRAKNAEPLAVSHLPWQFFYPGHFIDIKVGVKMKNLSSNIIGGNFEFSTEHEIMEGTQDSEEMDNILFYSINKFVDTAEFKIRLNLYSSKGLCSSLLVADGRTDRLIPMQHQHRICSGCTFVVDVSTECLDFPLEIESETTTTLKPVVKHYVPTTPNAVIETTIIKVTASTNFPLEIESETTTTLKPAVKHVTSNNVTDYVPHGITETTTIKVTPNGTNFPLEIESETTTTLKPVVKHVTSNNVTDYVPTSLHATIETTTIEVTTNITNATPTDSTTVIIISSTIGVVAVLIVIIAVWKCWTKNNTSGAPLIAPSDPFYLNMLFRRECDQEIAQIERHHYDEIEEHQNEIRENQYEEINL